MLTDASGCPPKLASVWSQPDFSLGRRSHPGTAPCAPVWEPAYALQKGRQVLVLLCIFRFCSNEDRYVCVGVLPECKEILIGWNWQRSYRPAKHKRGRPRRASIPFGSLNTTPRWLMIFKRLARSLARDCNRTAFPAKPNPNAAPYWPSRRFPTIRDLDTSTGTFLYSSALAQHSRGIQCPNFL
jgi:hypothetical protein